jgi:hypothetical protein
MLKLSEPKVFIRITSLKKEEGFGIGRTTLIKNWKLTNPNHTAKILVNGIQLTEAQNNFNISKIREDLRDLIPETSEENTRARLESNFFSGQLECLEHFSYFPSKFMFNFLFTGGLCITFQLSENYGDKVEIEECYVLSKAVLLEKLKRQSLEDIEKNNTEKTEDMNVK